MAPRLAKAIEFHDVSFAYGAKPVLTRINLTIPAGEVVALVGMSGAGKSTLRLAPPLVVDDYDVDTALAMIDGLLGELD